MKRAVFIFVLALCLVFVFACKSQADAINEVKEATTAEEESLRAIYQRYRTGLIMRGAETYTVVRGDTLSAISRTKYNDARYFPVIMMASSEIVLDPDKIEPGMELTIPDIQKNLDNPRSKANIKNFLNEIAKVEDDRNRPQDAEGLRNLASSL